MAGHQRRRPHLAAVAPARPGRPRPRHHHPSRAVAVTVLGTEPCLVTVSRDGEGLVVRLRGPGLERTLTAFSGEPATWSVHPTRPWLARTTATAVEVGDLETGRQLTRVGLVP